MECPKCRTGKVRVKEDSEIIIDGNKIYIVYCPICREYLQVRERVPPS